MAYASSSVSYSDPQEPATIPSAATGCCSKASTELKLYQAFIFSIPIFFTVILLFLFYLFYLRRRRVDWASIRMRNSSASHSSESDDTSRAELGLKKEVREMLPIIVFKQSFSVKDTLCHAKMFRIRVENIWKWLCDVSLSRDYHENVPKLSVPFRCSVCLGDYQAEEKLQQIPACGHTFHMDCIDHWLSTHATCPLCRQSILVSSKAVSEVPDIQSVSNNGYSHPQNSEETSSENGPEYCEDHQQQHGEMSPENVDERIPTTHEEEETTLQNVGRDG